MRKLLMSVVVLGIISLAGFSYGAEKATTDELPAALRALRPAAQAILTTDDAEDIRGEGGWRHHHHHHHHGHHGHHGHHHGHGKHHHKHHKHHKR